MPGRDSSPPLQGRGLSSCSQRSALRCEAPARPDSCGLISRATTGLLIFTHLVFFIADAWGMVRAEVGEGVDEWKTQMLWGQGRLRGMECARQERVGVGMGM